MTRQRDIRPAIRLAIVASDTFLRFAEDGAEGDDGEATGPPEPYRFDSILTALAGDLALEDREGIFVISTCDKVIRTLRRTT